MMPLNRLSPKPHPIIKNYDTILHTTGVMIVYIFLNFPIGAIINFAIFSNKSVKIKKLIFSPQKALPCAELRHMTYQT